MDPQLTGFLQSWRATNGVPAGTELTQAQLTKFVVDLQAQLRTVSIAPSDPSGIRSWAADAQVVPYGNSIGSEPMWRYAQAVSEAAGGKAYYITDTSAGRLLGDLNFRAEILKVVGPEFTQSSQTVERILGGQYAADGITRLSPYAVGTTLSLNDFVSQRLMSEGARGDVRILAPNASPDRVLITTELPALLENENVTHINGIEKAVFVEVFSRAQAAGGVDAARVALAEAVSVSSAELMRGMSTVGTGDSLRVDTGRFFAGSGIPDQHIAPDTAGLTSVGSLISEQLRVEGESGRWSRGAIALGSAINTVRVGGMIIGGAGGLASVFGAYDQAHKIKLALDNNDLDGAKALLTEYVAKGAAGWAAGAAAASTAGALLTPLLAAGPVGGVAYLVLTASAGFVGGVFGAEAVDKILNGLRGSNGALGLSGGTVTIDSEQWQKVTTFANGVRYIEPASGPGEGEPSTVWVTLHDRGPEVQIPDGQGGYIAIRAGEEGSAISQWSGIPGQSSELKSVTTTLRADGVYEASSRVNGMLVRRDEVSQTQDGRVREVSYANGLVTEGVTDRFGNRQTVVKTDGGVIVSYGTRTAFWEEDGLSFIDEVKNVLTGEHYFVGTDPAGLSKRVDIKTAADAAAERHRDEMYSDAAALISAIRSKDKAGLLVYGAKLTLDAARVDRLGDPALADAANFVGGAANALGIVGALRGLRSDNIVVQVGSAASLLSNANAMAVRLKVNDGQGFLSQEASQLLAGVGSVLSIAGLANLDKMIENGQYGAAASTIAGAVNGASFLASANSVGLANATFLIPGPWMAVIAIAGIVLDEILSEDPPPPPPVGSAVFKRNADGTLGFELQDAANGGAQILTQNMTGIVAKLNEQLAQANQDNTDPDRALRLVASRMPKVTIQSWPSYGNANYFFTIEQAHPGTGEKVYSGIAREDLVDNYAQTLLLPEAIVQQWQVNQLTMQFGTNEANWKTEGQYLSGLSSIEQQRRTLQQAVDAAEQSLAAAKKTVLSATVQFVSSGGITGNVTQQSGAVQSAVTAAEAALASARAQLEAFSADHPLNAQLAAAIIDPAITDPDKKRAAREEAARQWLKVVAVDLGGDGITKTALPGTVGKDLHSLQTDGVTRFDADNDGFREATEWIAPSEAILGIDRDGNGVLDSASELFNGIATPYDQRGLASLKYYDANHDGRIDSQDPVYKMLRLWIDLNGDGSAGSMETYDLQMRHPGVDMAALSARLDAAGQAAMTALQSSAVQWIDLTTFQLHLADQSIALASEVTLQSETDGVMVTVDPVTQNVGVLQENGQRDNYITVVEDMTELLELEDPNLPAARRAELEQLAQKWGLNTQSADFLAVVRSLRAGGQNMGGSGMAVYLGSNDVWTDPNVRHRLEQMRFSFIAAQTVGSADVFGTAKIGTPIVIGESVDTPAAESWLPPHKVLAGEVLGDTPTAPPPGGPTGDQWVILSDVYNLDFVVRGAQLGGLVEQTAVVASNTATPTAPNQTIQVYTAAKPTSTLATATIAGKEDQEFGFGFAQLEQEARSLIPGATATTAVRLLGVRSVSHGHVTMDEATGRVRFQADANYVGPDAGFSYAIMDDQGRVMERRVNFTLAEVNDAPTVLGETVLAREDVPLLFDAATLLANDSDLEGDALTIIGIGRVGMGHAQLLDNGQIRYTPPADLYGTTDTVEYIVRDARGASSIGVIKISLTAVDDAPTVVSEVIRNAKEDTTLRVDPALLLANDFDPDNHNQAAVSALRITAVGAATHGQVFMDATGGIVFVPTDNFNGTATFEYTVTDATGLSTTGKAEVEVGAINDGPRAFGEQITSQEDQPLVIDPDLLLANDDDIDIQRGENQRLMVVAVDQAVNGTVALANGHVTFTPTQNFSGQASFRYVVSDGAGGFAQAVATIQVAPVNDAPTVVNRQFKGTEDTAYAITTQQLLAGIVDPEDGTTGVHLVRVENVKNATLVQNGAQFTLTPGPNFNGAATFDYVVADASGAESKGQVSVDFNPVDDAPVFLPGSTFTKQGEEDQVVRISAAAITSMFVDVDGEAVHVDPASLAAVSAGDQVWWDAARQEIVFRAAPNANGVRQFDVRVADPDGTSSATKRLSVDIKALNDTPLVNAVHFQVLEDGGPTAGTAQRSADHTVSWLSYAAILANASDADGDALTVSWVSPSGTTDDGRAVTLSIDAANQRIGITPPQNFNGFFTFQYAISDGHGGVTQQTAYGQVVPVNDLPDVSLVKDGQFRLWDTWEYWHAVGTDVDGVITSYGIQTHPLRGELKQIGFNSFFLDSQDGKGYASEDQTAVISATDDAGGTSLANLNFVFHWDPLVIDLGADGLDFIAASESSVLFDRDGDGDLERSSWIRGNEGILAWDYDGTGTITHFDEIEFWSHVQPEDPTRTDLQSLAHVEFDSNQDGVFDAQDARWGQFRLWRDLNGNGIGEANEVTTLAQAGITSVELNANLLNRQYGPDVLVRGYTQVHMADGRSLQVADVQLGLQDAATPTPTGSGTAVAMTEQQYELNLLARQQELAAARHAGDGNFSGALGDQKLLTGRAYHYVLPADLFPALGAGTTYALTMADGQPLPAWLAYDAATRTLSGTPANGQMGLWSVTVKATSATGATQSGALRLEVTDFNQAPLVYGAVPTQFAMEDEPFSLRVAPNFFIDREAGDTVRVSARLSNGQPLPSWLTFDPQTLTLQGTPGNANVGVLDIVLVASDEANASSQSKFQLVVSNVNDAPVVNNAPGIIGMVAGQANSYLLPADMFVDPDAGDTLTWSVTLANGDALPSWLTFNVGNRSLNATPTEQQIASPLQLKVTVNDTHGATTSTLVTVSSTLYVHSDNAPLVGGAYSETLIGDARNNSLDGGAGADTMYGGAGDDTYIVDRLDQVIEFAGQGTDTIRSQGDWTLGDNLENLTLTGTLAVDGTGNGLDNVLTGNSAANVLAGKAGNDTYVIDALDTVVENAGEGVDTVQAGFSYTLAPHVENLVLTGAAAINGTGNALANVITGNAADNVLDGAAGADTMQGGAGNDTYVVDNVGDVVVENAAAGTDTVQASVTYTLATNVENLVLTGSAAINGTGNALDNVLTGNAGANVLAGGFGNDTYIIDSLDTVVEVAGQGTDTVKAAFSYTLAGNVENLVLMGGSAIDGAGNALNNTITGNAAANTLDGGSGADTLAGGAGNDTYVVDNASDVVMENAGEGTDTVRSTVTYTLAANVENLVLTGIASINGTGNAMDNTLTGNAGANVLNGGVGADTLVGGAGNDTYVVDNPGDVVVENAGEGTDAVQASVTYTLTANVENLVLTGSAAINGTGNALANTLTGNAAANVLAGGAGNDIYVVDAYDTVIENANEGTDTVQAGFAYALGANVENLTLTGTAAINGTGNALDNVLTGNSGANMLSGGAGNDTYVVGAGDSVNESTTTTQMVDQGHYESRQVDQGYWATRQVEVTEWVEGPKGGWVKVTYYETETYWQSVWVTETYWVSNWVQVSSTTDSGGVDTVQSSVDQSLGAYVENLTLTGTADLKGTGNELANVITGNAGANVLDGGAGADTLAGGAGNDTYIVDAQDTVIENPGAGTDTVLAGFSYILGANVENLVLTGTAAINGTGNALTNVMTGNAAANVLDGGAGADSLAGGAGNDTYVVDNAGDAVVENTAEGVDTVQASVTYTLTANVENLVLSGTAAINGSGNALDNVLTGNGAANILAGGAGNDTYVVDALDTVVENAGEGVDTVQSSGSFVLGDNIETLVLTGAAAINGTGNAGHNLLVGNSAANVLTGGAGNDTYVIDSLDTVVEAVGDGTDTVQAGFSYTLAANVENLLLTGSAAINGAGNALDNTLTGNAAANVLAGGAGNDTYVIDSLDTVIENAGEGVDTVQAGFTYTLGANVENLTLTGTAAINATGNALDNVLTGNAGANVLTGGAGNDTYVIDGTDTVVETVTTTQTVDQGYYATRQVDQGYYATRQVDQGYWATRQVIVDYEEMYDYKGRYIGMQPVYGTETYWVSNWVTETYWVSNWVTETYWVSNPVQVTTVSDSGGVDTVQSSASYTLGSYVENLTLTGSAAINATGNALANTLSGNAGNNVLNGGAGNDTYLFGRGSAGDTIQDQDATAGNTDVLRFASSVATDQLWFRQSGNDLEVSIIGTGDKVTVSNWYLGGQYQVEQFKTTDGNKTLLASQVQNLVNAMASFAPPAAGQTTLSSAYGTTLNPVIAANWQ